LGEGSGRMATRKLEFEALESLRKDIAFRIEEIENMQIELEVLKQIQKRIDNKISEVKAKLKEGDISAG
jgi:hypothetical protein